MLQAVSGQSRRPGSQAHLSSRPCACRAAWREKSLEAGTRKPQKRVRNQVWECGSRSACMPGGRAPESRFRFWATTAGPSGSPCVFYGILKRRLWWWRPPPFSYLRIATALGNPLLCRVWARPWDASSLTPTPDTCLLLGARLLARRSWNPVTVTWKSLE